MTSAAMQAVHFSSDRPTGWVGSGQVGLGHSFCNDQQNRLGPDFANIILYGEIIWLITAGRVKIFVITNGSGRVRSSFLWVESGREK